MEVYKAPVNASANHTNFATTSHQPAGQQGHGAALKNPAYHDNAAGHHVPPTSARANSALWHGVPTTKTHFGRLTAAGAALAFSANVMASDNTQPIPAFNPNEHVIVIPAEYEGGGDLQFATAQTRAQLAMPNANHIPTHAIIYQGLRGKNTNEAINGVWQTWSGDKRFDAAAEVMVLVDMDDFDARGNLKPDDAYFNSDIRIRVGATWELDLGLTPAAVTRLKQEYFDPKALPPAGTNPDYDAALAALLLGVENYIDIAVDAKVRDLQSKISQAEDILAIAEIKKYLSRDDEVRLKAAMTAAQKALAAGESSVGTELTLIKIAAPALSAALADAQENMERVQKIEGDFDDAVTRAKVYLTTDARLYVDADFTELKTQLAAAERVKASGTAAAKQDVTSKLNALSARLALQTQTVAANAAQLKRTFYDLQTIIENKENSAFFTANNIDTKPALDEIATAQELLAGSDASDAVKIRAALEVMTAYKKNLDEKSAAWSMAKLSTNGEVERIAATLEYNVKLLEGENLTELRQELAAAQTLVKSSYDTRQLVAIEQKFNARYETLNTRITELQAIHDRHVRMMMGGATALALFGVFSTWFITSYNRSKAAAQMLIDKFKANLEGLRAKWVDYNVSQFMEDDSALLAGQHGETAILYAEIRDFLTQAPEMLQNLDEIAREAQTKLDSAHWFKRDPFYRVANIIRTGSETGTTSHGQNNPGQMAAELDTMLDTNQAKWQELIVALSAAKRGSAEKDFPTTKLEALYKKLEATKISPKFWLADHPLNNSAAFWQDLETLRQQDSISHVRFIKKLKNDEAVMEAYVDALVKGVTDVRVKQALADSLVLNATVTQVTNPAYSTQELERRAADHWNGAEVFLKELDKMGAQAGSGQGQEEEPQNGEAAVIDAVSDVASGAAAMVDATKELEQFDKFMTITAQVNAAYDAIIATRQKIKAAVENSAKHLATIRLGKDALNSGIGEVETLLAGLARVHSNESLVPIQALFTSIRGHFNRATTLLDEAHLLLDQKNHVDAAIKIADADQILQATIVALSGIREAIHNIEAQRTQYAALHANFDATRRGYVDQVRSLLDSTDDQGWLKAGDDLQWHLPSPGSKADWQRAVAQMDEIRFRWVTAIDVAQTEVNVGRLEHDLALAEAKAQYMAKAFTKQDMQPVWQEIDQAKKDIAAAQAIQATATRLAKFGEMEEAKIKDTEAESALLRATANVKDVIHAIRRLERAKDEYAIYYTELQANREKYTRRLRNCDHHDHNEILKDGNTAFSLLNQPGSDAINYVLMLAQALAVNKLWETEVAVREEAKKRRDRQSAAMAAATAANWSSAATGSYRPQHQPNQGGGGNIDLGGLFGGGGGHRHTHQSGGGLFGGSGGGHRATHQSGGGGFGHKGRRH